jgi:hypothetical protein
MSAGRCQVSVIVTLYNTEKYIAECLGSASADFIESSASRTHLERPTIRNETSHTNPKRQPGMN